MGADQAILEAVHGLAGRSALLDGTALAVSTLGAIVLAALILATRRRGRIIAGIVGLAGATLVGELLNAVTARARPVVADPLVLRTGLDSFPSGHTAAAFALAAALGLHDKRLGIAAYALASLVGLSRVFIGVHYPSDVLAGALLGVLAGLGAHWLVKRSRWA